MLSGLRGETGTSHFGLQKFKSYSKKLLEDVENFIQGSLKSNGQLLQFQDFCDY
jgi:hypothetical protein